MSREETKKELERLVSTVKAKTFFQKIKNFTAKQAIWPLPVGTACCALEYISAIGFKDNLPFWEPHLNCSPYQADLMIVAGTITKKQAPTIKELYNKMPSPKWVLAMGACACSGGFYDAYNVISGLAKLIPVDVYVPGCPPTPEALIEGVQLVKDRIDKGVCAATSKPKKNEQR